MEKITEDYVSFETAKLLKEKGFKGLGAHFYDTAGNFLHFDAWMRALPEEKYEFIEAPTLQMAMKWLREKYNIHIEPRYFPMPNIYRYVIIHSPTTIENIGSHPQYFNSYEEACEEAIKCCLDILI